MADITYKSEDKTEQVDAKKTTALLVMPDGEGFHRVYYDVSQASSGEKILELIKLGATVICMFRDMGILPDVLAFIRRPEGTSEFRFRSEVMKPEDL